MVKWKWCYFCCYREIVFEIYILYFFLEWYGNYNKVLDILEYVNKLFFVFKKVKNYVGFYLYLCFFFMILKVIVLNWFINFLIVLDLFKVFYKRKIDIDFWVRKVFLFIFMMFL